MRILIIEDQQELSEAIKTYLVQKKHLCDQAYTIRDAKIMVSGTEFSCILLDMILPDGRGVDFLKKIRAKNIRTPVIITTAKDQITDRILGLESGADDYITKPFNLDEMYARLCAVERRYQGITSPSFKINNIEIFIDRKICLKNHNEIALTAKEWSIIERLIKSPNQIVTKKQLEASVYSYESEIESNTLEVYISQIRKKLGPTLIETSRGLGYRIGRS